MVSQQLLQQLLANLTSQYQLHQQMLQVLRDKQCAMRDCMISALEAAMNREQQLSDKLKAMEVQRQAVVAKIAAEIGLPADRSPTLSEILPHVEPAQQGRLGSLASAIRAVAEELARVNRVSGSAVRKVLEHFHGIFRIIAEAGTDMGLYDRSGERPRLPARNLIDAIA